MTRTPATAPRGPRSPRASAAATPIAAALVLFALATARADITIGAPTNHLVVTNVTGCPPGTSATVTLNPANVAHLGVPGAMSTFATTFTADQGQYPGWTIAFGGALNGTLNITDYLAVDYGNCVGGARFDATYAPAAGDPSNLTFIQMFTDNVDGGRMHIDPFPNDDTEPFYYTVTERTTFGLRFVDNPRDPCPGFPGERNVRFETYLTSFDATAMTLTVHDGWAWGYDLVCIPTPGSIVLIAIGLAAACARRRR